MFAKINAECKQDKQSANKLAIIELDEQSDKWAPKYRIDFDTKYYELQLSLIIIETTNLAFDQIDFKALETRFSSLKGLIIYSNEQNEQCLLGKDFRQFIKSACMHASIKCVCHQISEFKEIFMLFQV